MSDCYTVDSDVPDFLSNAVIHDVLDISNHLYPISFEKGLMMTGRFPPMLFMRNKNIPKIVVFKCGGDTSTIVTNTIPNQVSAASRNHVEN